MDDESARARPVVRCDGVARTYGRGRTAVVALHGFSGQVSPGEQLALTGRSGSGKSTLLHLMAGIDVPTTGTVRWPALGASPSALRPGTVGVVFQGPSLLPALTVAENVALPLLLARESEAQAGLRTEGLLCEFGLEGVAARLPEEISGGQAQRASVARALAGRPLLIVADEPTGQLDGDTGRRTMSALLAGAARLGAAVVVATHDPAVAALFSRRWQLTDGQLRATGEPSWA